MLTSVMQPFSLCEKYGERSSVWHKGSDFPTDVGEPRTGGAPSPGQGGGALPTSGHHSVRNAEPPAPSTSHLTSEAGRTELHGAPAFSKGTCSQVDRSNTETPRSTWSQRSVLKKTGSEEGALSLGSKPSCRSWLALDV